MRLVPKMEIFAPPDINSLVNLLPIIKDNNLPTYVRYPHANLELDFSEYEIDSNDDFIRFGEVTLLSQFLLMVY